MPQDYGEAVRWYTKAANQGFAPAENNLGVMYRYGWGVPKDDPEALKWFRKAADHGAATAEYTLGLMYEQGTTGVPQNYSIAAALFRKAADQDFDLAEFRLGILYEWGLGVPQDYVQAERWYILAATHRLPQAVNLRDALAAKLTPDQIAAAQKLAGR